jgi:hypothetical protein
MTTHITKTWFDGEKVVTQEIAESEVYKQEPVAWAEEIIEDLNALFDTEMIKEIDSGDALIRLDAAICAVEEADKRHTTLPAADDLIATYEKGFKDGAAQRKPLTDEELRVIENKINPNMRWRSSDEEGITLYPNEYYDLVKAIEAAHGITGGKK